ncbi:MAG: hypothetical protein ACRDB0_04960 [Paraclostridium sp.]
MDPKKRNRDDFFLKYNTYNCSFKTYDSLVRGLNILYEQLEHRSFRRYCDYLKMKDTIVPNGARYKKTKNYTDTKPSEPINIAQISHLNELVDRIEPLKPYMRTFDKMAYNSILVSIMSSYVEGLAKGTDFFYSSDIPVSYIKKESF